MVWSSVGSLTLVRFQVLADGCVKFLRLVALVNHFSNDLKATLSLICYQQYTPTNERRIDGNCIPARFLILDKLCSSVSSLTDISKGEMTDSRETARRASLTRGTSPLPPRFYPSPRPA